ncbi:hypothetical protein ACI2KO_07720 [Pseudomonas piscis]|uniref:hypothetical protein n=1 Tax=Pseudomonas piscis TaxID=2614538 RepID=UPI00384B16A8
MNMNSKKRRKPRGRSGQIAVGTEGVIYQPTELPETKDEIEKYVADAFCAGKVARNPQIERYGCFKNLEQGPENGLDFKVETEMGGRWLELAELAPLSQFGGSYENVPATWSVNDLAEHLRNLIQKKNEKKYGAGVILVIYKTHDTLFVPPPIIRSIREELAVTPPIFDSIYFVSPYEAGAAGVWQIWPADPKDQGPVVKSGSVRILTHVDLVPGSEHN